jgi:N-methylhydantoinase A/oxoprolinase/acetone carboxylase beta subunit
LLRIGIDVGGTNTDAVLVENRTVSAAVKRPTTEDVTEGIVDALEALLRKSEVEQERVDAVMIGTTHFTNAVVERRGLEKIAAVRIGLPASRSLPPFSDWPEDLAALVEGAVFSIEGGHEYDGRPIVPFDTDEMRRVARSIAEHGLTSVAVTAIFSPLAEECEETARRILAEEAERANRHLDVTLSRSIGRIGLLGRENATLLNAAIVSLARRATSSFTNALAEVGMEAPLFITQNDGTVVQASIAEQFPVFSFASGPTNSMRGASFLSGLDDALVIDVGGTTSDVGMLKSSFPREANNVVEIGGVRTLFRMPDLLSIGLGGGSLVDARDPVRVGPKSVGYRLTERALVFGGDTCTATDIAAAGGLVELGDATSVRALPSDLVERVRERIEDSLFEAVDRMKTDARPVPLIAVGGAAFLVPPSLAGISRVVRVPYGEVANAVGAAIAQVSGEVDQVFHGMERDEAIAAATELACERAVSAGASRNGVEVVDVDDIPIAYLPGNARRVHVRVVGEARPGSDTGA